MAGPTQVSTALELSNTFHDPINLFIKDQWIGNKVYARERQVDGRTVRELGNFYEHHPVMSRFIFIPIGFMNGIVKPISFIIMTAIAAIVMPIIGAIKGLRGGQEQLACNYIKAGALNLLGFVATAAFFVVSAYYIPLAGSATIFMGAVTFSIVVHVYRASMDPPSSKGLETVHVVQFSAAAAASGADGSVVVQIGGAGAGSGNGAAVSEGVASTADEEDDSSHGPTAAAAAANGSAVASGSGIVSSPPQPPRASASSAASDVVIVSGGVPAGSDGTASASVTVVPLPAPTAQPAGASSASASTTAAAAATADVV